MAQILSVLSPDDYIYLRSRQRNLADADRSYVGGRWNIFAKADAANRIKDEENKRHPGRNGPQDAMRHAEWSRRTAVEAGPIFSTVAGFAHEIDNLVSGDGPISESFMDLMNNAEGVAAAREGRAVDRSRLQNDPISYRAVLGRREDNYDDTSPDRAGYPSRPYGSQGSSRGGYKDGPTRRRPEDRYPAY